MATSCARQMPVLLCTMGLSMACSSKTPAEIWIDVSPVNVGIRSTATDLEPYHFDLQLINRGEEVLTFTSVKVRGDQHCAFSFEGPDVTSLEQEQAAFLRGYYKPSVEGEDQVVLEITSNAVNYPVLVVPVCGLAVSPETTEAAPIECVAPPETQASCDGQEVVY